MFPANDNFSNAFTLVGDSISVTGSNIDATGEFGEPNHAGVNFDDFDVNSVWWTWTAPENGLAVIDTIGSSYDTSLAVYTGFQLNNLLELDSNDDTFGLQSQVSFAAIAGETYQIAVDGFSDSQGDIVLNLDLTIPTSDLPPVPGKVADFGFESGTFSGFSTLGNTDIETASFGVFPTEGNFQALLSTSGFGASEADIEDFLSLSSGSLDALGNGNATAGSAIRLDSITVEAGEILSFDWNFLTDEFTPTFFNDFGFVVIGEASTLANTNDIFTLSPSSFNEETGYQQFEFTFDTAGTYDIGFGVIDVGDTVVDSGLLVDNIRLFSEIVGTDAGDNLNGSGADERIRGLGGNDIINSNGGADVLLGDGGNDRIAGSSKHDFIDGGTGRDTLFGNGGKDTLVGGAGNDLIYGGADADTIDAGAGNDTIFANGGGDIINSGAGVDTVFLGSGEATVTLDVGTGFDTINNFQLGSTSLDVSDINALSFEDSSSGARILQGGDLLAVVSFQLASTFSDNVDTIFV